MRKIGGLVLISAAIFLTACTSAEAAPAEAPASWHKLAQENPQVVEQIKSACQSIDTATRIPGENAATVKRIAQKHCPR